MGSLRRPERDPSRPRGLSASIRHGNVALLVDRSMAGVTCATPTSSGEAKGGDAQRDGAGEIFWMLGVVVRQTEDEFGALIVYVDVPLRSTDDERINPVYTSTD